MRALVLALFLGAAALESAALNASGEPSGHPRADLLERFLASAAPRLVSYRAERRLEASSLGGQLHATLDAITYLDADGRFRFDVVRESGSALIRDRVLVAALRTEQQSYDRRETHLLELTPENYAFQILPGTAPQTMRLGLSARRKSTMLLNGSAIVTVADGDLVRLEGSPAELPSYWTRRVDIVCRYSRIEGVRVTTELRSRADVRIGGESTFSMKYAYTMINGNAVDD